MSLYPDKILEQFEGKKILITGASGYIGSHLREALKKANCQVTHVTRKKINKNEIEWSDSQTLRDALREIDIIFHLSAQTSAYKSEEDPISDFSSNVGNLNILLSNIHLNKKTNGKNQPKLIMASTVTVYGLTPSLSTSESYQTSPTTIYDVDKLTAENYLENFCKRGSVRGAALRLANVYGPGVSSSVNDRGILNQIIKKGVNNELVTIFGDGNYLRDYIFVEDVVSAFLYAAIKAPLNGERYNIASGESRTLINAVKEVSSILKDNGYGPLEIKYVPEPDHLLPIEKRNFIANIEKIKKETTWAPLVNFKDGVLETLRSFK